MRKIKEQKKDRFAQDEEMKSAQDNLQVSNFTSEGAPDVQAQVNALGEAQDQSRDEKLVDNIQKEIEKNKSLSPLLSNIQVMANSGIVTLEGVVFSEEEKIMVGERAAVFAGIKNINNNLEVTSKN